VPRPELRLSGPSSLRLDHDELPRGQPAQDLSLTTLYDSHLNVDVSTAGSLDYLNLAALPVRADGTLRDKEHVGLPLQGHNGLGV
jgi:hypothetical protein